jgi:hypothetical protein
MLTNTDINNGVGEITVPQGIYDAAINKLFGTNVYASYSGPDPPIHPLCIQVHCGQSSDIKLPMHSASLENYKKHIVLLETK